MDKNINTAQWPIILNEEIFKTLVEEAPTPVGLYIGREMKIALVNKSILQSWGKDISILGKTFREALPEMEGQPYIQILDDVYTSGISYNTKAAKVLLKKEGQLNTYYFDFTYTPLKQDDKVWGILNTASDVTEMVLAKQKVTEAEERLNFALTSAGVGTWNLDPETNTVNWDRRCQELHGFALSDEVPYEDVLNNLHPDDKVRVQEGVEKALNPEGNRTYDMVFRTISSVDGKQRWVHSIGRAYFEENKTIRFSGIAIDITEEMVIRNEREKLLSLIENSSDYMAISTSEGRKTYLNRAGRRLVGLDENENISMHSASDFYAENEENQRLLPATFIEGTSHNKVFLKHIKTGEIIPCQADYVRIDDPLTGKPAGRGSIVRDLRPELAAQKALTESEDLFRRITTASPAALWITDEEGNISYVNKIWIDWTGAPLENHLGTGWLNYVTAEDKKTAADRFISDFSNFRFHESTFRIVHATSGKQRWVVCTGNPQYRPDGSFSGYIGACVDITEQKQLERQKDDFIGIASHELRTPVTSIKAYAQVLEAMFVKMGDENKAAMLHKMDGQLNRLTSLISDLLDVTKINTGRLQLNHTRFSFNDMINEAVDDLQRITTKHTIIKDFTATGFVTADRDRLMQVITNLISNAIKYSPHSEKIIVHTNHQNNEIEVCVQDFGIGISQEKQGQVFEQFYRVSGDMQHTFPGLGLGLYISSEIVKREGGRIWVNSEEGQGSTFCFAIPDNLSEGTITN